MLALLGLLACDDTIFESGGGGGTGGGSGYCAVQAIFDDKCTSCHRSGGSPLGDLDLETDPIAALVDVPSANYAGETLVVPGDPDASFLVAKLEDTQAADEGDGMPVGSPLPQASIDVVRAWIADGATTACDGTTTEPPVCDTTNEDCGPGSCRAAENPQMLPGADCLACHSAGGDPEAPRFGAAGTAFVDDAGTAPLAGATIHLVDDAGTTVDLTTNAAGNFYTMQTLVFPFTASIEVDGATLEMGEHPTTGGCNHCHRCDGEAGGKLYGP